MDPPLAPSTDIPYVQPKSLELFSPMSPLPPAIDDVTSASRICQALKSKFYNYQCDGSSGSKNSYSGSPVGVSSGVEWSEAGRRRGADIQRILPSLEQQHRIAQDSLLLAQLSAGRIPEEFLQKAAHSPHMHVTVDLSNYGIGDTQGLCLSNRYDLLLGTGSLTYIFAVPFSLSINVTFLL